MPSSHAARKSHNERIARERAQHTHVYISGLSGHHTLERGLAYYYRGHYIYAYPAGNLIEPIPYSTRKGIMIQGIVSASAPGYDKEDEGLVEEESIRALEASVEGEKRAKEESEEDKAKEVVCALEDGVDVVNTSRTPAPFLTDLLVNEALKPSSRSASPSLRPPPAAEALPPTITSFAVLRDAALNTFTPQLGARFLAASAPGSRLASRAASPSGLRPTSSHVGLARLGSIRGHTHHLNIPIHTANSSTEDTPSRPASSVRYLYGLGDHALSIEDLPRPVGVSSGGRVAPCTIHGEECDGVSVKELWLTKRVVSGLGFVEELPMMERGGRVMVDWAELLEEARAEGGQ
ncbi:hypothetical protein BU25DRAFT_465081 [Macroventuria anomochaeta]|uniref:Uncharacterized protein n=1 Tax=Macroventuria anomochaeta TaxID=301207 RepID=A0ACB6SHY9_9PLEO|nr:uncharacterized protein BU25DRAFT_465081 [Macroventuria anomochaeta]KAF2633856.1 hypothetical protein BU25DRAFT_465081 [Macroventuria anomochaeta]